MKKQSHLLLRVKFPPKKPKRHKLGIKMTYHDASQRIILDAINDGIVISNPKNILTLVNNKFEVLFGVSQYNLEGKNEKLLVNLLKDKIDDSKGELNTFFKGVLSKGSFKGGTIKIRFKDTKTRILSLYTSPMFDQGLTYLGRVWKFEDKTIEEQINRMKSEFISIASHQLRTPLTSIKGYLAMVFEGDYGKIPGELEEPLQAVKKSSERMIDLVNALLDVSRLEMGRIVPEYSRVDLIKLIKQVIDDNKELAIKKHQKIIFKNNAKRISTNSDSKLISESLKNYLTNAIKYSPEKSRILVSLELKDNLHILKVKDEGVGIPSEAKERLFDKFYRADNVLTENFEGTGLGLYYVKKAIEALRGKVGFESRLGEGSTFWFSLP